MEHQELKINKVPPPPPAATGLQYSQTLAHPPLPFCWLYTVWDIPLFLTTMVPVALFLFTGLFRIFLEFIPFTTPLANDNFTFYSKPKIRNIVGGFLPPNKIKAVLLNDSSWTLSMIIMSGSHSYTFFLNFHCLNICFRYLYECLKFMRSIFGGHHLFVGVSVIFRKQFWVSHMNILSSAPPSVCSSSGHWRGRCHGNVAVGARRLPKVGQGGDMPSRKGGNAALTESRLT